MTSDALVPERTRQALLTGALRELAFAVQAMELYPPKSPMVMEAVERARAGLAPLVQHGSLTIEVRPDSLALNGREVGEGQAALSKLAKRLHFRRVARLRLDPSLDSAALLALAQGTGMDRRELEAAGGIDAFLSHFRGPGVHIELLELDQLFDEDGEVVEDEDVWDRMLRRFQTATLAPDASWEELAVDPEQLSAFLTWVIENIGSVDELAEFSTVELLRLAIERIGNAAPGAGAERLGPMAQAFDTLCDDLSSEALIELLSEPLMIQDPAVPAAGAADDAVDADGTGDAATTGAEGDAAGAAVDEGQGGADGAAMDGRGEIAEGADGAAIDEVGSAEEREYVEAAGEIDATREIARGLQAPRVEDLIVYAIQSREQTSARLVQLFSRLLSERDDRVEIATAVERTFQGTDGMGAGALLDAWPNLHDVLLGETPEPYVSQRYAATLDRLDAAPTAGVDLWPVDRIRPRFREMAPLALLQQKCEVLLSLLDQERDATDYADLAIELEKGLPEFVLHEEYQLVERVLATFASHAQADSGRPAGQPEIAREVLARFANRHTLLQLVRSLTGKPHSAVLMGMRIFSHLGSIAVPALLSALWQEKSRPGRLLLLRVLTSMADDVIPEIEKHLEDERWFVVRNLVWIIRELGDPDLIRPLSLTVRHPDPRVRRESVLALGKIGGTEAAELLLLCIEDESRDTQLDAIRGVGLNGLRRAIPRLRPNLELVNWRGQNADILEATIVALARLGDRRSVPRFRQLARRPLLFPARRSLVREAARWALQTLQATEPGLTDVVTGWMRGRVRPGSRRLWSAARRSWPGSDAADDHAGRDDRDGAR